QKMWTSLSSDADYCWLAVRTDPDAPKHKGISILIMPMNTPGISLQPLNLIGEHDINAMYLDDVRIPVANCVGGENKGWTLITNQLNHERVTLCSTGVVERALADTLEWAKNTTLPDGRRVADQEWVQLNLARVHAKLDVLRLMNWQSAWEATQGVLDVGHCSAIKVYGTEFYLEAFRLLFEILGPPGYLKSGTPGSILKARLENLYRGMLILTFGGGTNEMQRDLITMFSLGFPRAAR
ncbi:MAG: acyl-CoA dehydrogenase family protein, partial [Ilumatobacteraceae bacterium]